MTIALDAHYTIGKLHLYCEDYVCHGWKPFPHLILADGCSASPDSDVGARLLALNARRLLPRFALTAAGKAGQAAPHWRLGRQIVRRAARQARELGLRPEALDATLLIAWCDGATVYAHLYGDGCIAVRRVAGAMSVVQIEYAENAPYYLSYLLDPERWAFYREAIGDPATAQSVRYLGETGESTRREHFAAPTVFSFDLATFPVVAVATDGLASFMNVATGERGAVLDVARTLLDFHDPNDDFVKLRLHEVLIEYGRQRLFNLDDLGLGVFVRTN